ncbi:hypothetical protein NDU88_007498 [Pleurodeles waltl]|uniref:Uncharacterized protein n=1 Tax=Pleurodeles waltl TaxID=8319 RepID=A0AAV7RRZ0_PLEWA|nr:hypothetical protein NDU88_007498 [Pleurodeles waltl]
MQMQQCCGGALVTMVSSVLEWEPGFFFRAMAQFMPPEILRPCPVSRRRPCSGTESDQAEVSVPGPLTCGLIGVGLSALVSLLWRYQAPAPMGACRGHGPQARPLLRTGPLSRRRTTATRESSPQLLL